MNKQDRQIAQIIKRIKEEQDLALWIDCQIAIFQDRSEMLLKQAEEIENKLLNKGKNDSKE